VGVGVGVVRGNGQQRDGDGPVGDAHLELVGGPVGRVGEGVPAARVEQLVGHAAARPDVALADVDERVVGRRADELRAAVGQVACANDDREAQQPRNSREPRDRVASS